MNNNININSTNERTNEQRTNERETFIQICFAIWRIGTVITALITSYVIIRNSLLYLIKCHKFSFIELLVVNVELD